MLPVGAVPPRVHISSIEPIFDVIGSDVAHGSWQAINSIRLCMLSILVLILPITRSCTSSSLTLIGAMVCSRRANDLLFNLC